MSGLKERIAGMSLELRALREEHLPRTNRQGRRPSRILGGRSSDPAFLSFGQQQMWFRDQLTPGTATCNAADVMEVIGALSAEAREHSFSAVIARHEILRTRLGSVDGSLLPAVRASRVYP